MYNKVKIIPFLYNISKGTKCEVSNFCPVSGITNFILPFPWPNKNWNIDELYIFEVTCWIKSPLPAKKSLNDFCQNH